jgi:hypothetical protein
LNLPIGGNKYESDATNVSPGPADAT